MLQKFKWCQSVASQLRGVKLRVPQKYTVYVQQAEAQWPWTILLSNSFQPVHITEEDKEESKLEREMERYVSFLQKIPIPTALCMNIFKVWLTIYLVNYDSSYSYYLTYFPFITTTDIEWKSFKRKLFVAKFPIEW